MTEESKDNCDDDKKLQNELIIFTERFKNSPYSTPREMIDAEIKKSMDEEKK